MATPASTGLSVSSARPAAPVLPKALVVIDQSDMYTNVFSRFADGHTGMAGMFGRVRYLSIMGYTQSPFVPCVSRHAQSGRRTSFRRWVWFIESRIVLAILFYIY
jgi:hypothetical protein